MKWFKHMSDALEDPFIQALLDEYKHKGYVVWFGLLEVISKENGNKLTGKIEVKPKYLKRKFRVSVTKLEEMFNFCATFHEQKCQKSDTKPKLLFHKKELLWILEVPKILEIKDNYTKDLQATGKKLSKHKEVEAENRVQKEKKKKEINTLPPDPEDYKIPENLVKWSKEKGLSIEELKNHAETCLIWHGSKGNKYARWDRVIQNWINKDLKDNPKNNGQYDFL